MQPRFNACCHACRQVQKLEKALQALEVKLEADSRTHRSDKHRLLQVRDVPVCRLDATVSPLARQWLTTFTVPWQENHNLVQEINELRHQLPH